MSSSTNQSEDKSRRIYFRVSMTKDTIEIKKLLLVTHFLSRRIRRDSFFVKNPKKKPLPFKCTKVKRQKKKKAEDEKQVPSLKMKV